MTERSDRRDHEGLSVRLQQREPIPLSAAFDCARGELLALVGPSGSGKTTILRAIAGLVRPAGGQMSCEQERWFDAETGTLVTPQDRRVGFVFQDYALFPHLDALDNVAIAAPGQSRDQRRAIARETLARVNLSGLENRKPDALSGGQQQRVALARALARQPRVLLLDEPFAAVDQVTRERLKRELAQLRRSLDIPIILVTHDLDEALALGDRIAVLYRGETLQVGAVDEVRLKPRSATVARLLGQTNVFAGVVAKRATDGKPGQITAGTGEARVAFEVTSTGAWREGERIAWMVASEHVILHRRGRPSQGDRENPVAGTLLDVTPLGEQTAVTVQLPGLGADASGVLNFRLPTHTARRNELVAGADVVVSLLAAGLHLMPAEDGA